MPGPHPWEGQWAGCKDNGGGGQTEPQPPPRTPGGIPTDPSCLMPGRVLGTSLHPSQKGLQRPSPSPAAEGGAPHPTPLSPHCGGGVEFKSSGRSTLKRRYRISPMFILALKSQALNECLTKALGARRFWNPAFWSCTHRQSADGIPHLPPATTPHSPSHPDPAEEAPQGLYEIYPLHQH